VSKEVQQFVELVQEAAAKIASKPRVYYLYCQNCGGKTAHVLVVVSSRWEHYSYQACGCQKSYKVR